MRTRHVLFVFSGAFTGLEKTLRQQHAPPAPPNERDERDEAEGTPADVLELAKTADLVRAGLEPEFVGRLPVRVACRHLTADDLVGVLRDAHDSVAAQLTRDFRGYGIELALTEEALREVAERASAQGTGARGLLTVLEETLRDFKFELPGRGVTRLEVDADTVRRPAERLQALLEEHPGGQ